MHAMPECKCRDGYTFAILNNLKHMNLATLELGEGGSSCPCLLLGGGREANVPFKYKEYCIRH